MPKYFQPKVLNAVMRVNQQTFMISSDCIDGEVSTKEIIFQTDIRIGREDKTFIALTRLSFSSCKGIFFVALGVQKHGEILAHGGESRSQHLIDGGTDHHEVSVLAGFTEQCISNRTAYTKYLN
jgi:hypothetical protein